MKGHISNQCPQRQGDKGGFNKGGFNKGGKGGFNKGGGGFNKGGFNKGGAGGFNKFSKDNANQSSNKVTKFDD